MVTLRKRTPKTIDFAQRLSGPLFNYSDTWQLVINTATTIVTFLMVFLIQNTQNRDATAAGGQKRPGSLFYCGKKTRRVCVLAAVSVLGSWPPAIHGGQ